MKIKGILLFTAIIVLLTLNSFAVAPIQSNGGVVTSAEEFVAALGGNYAAYNEDNIIILKSDVTLKAPIIIKSGEYVIRGAGCYIYNGNNNEALFIVEGADTKLILGNDKGSDNHPSLSLFGDGNKGNAVIVRNGNVDIYQGTLISGFESDYGAGIRVDNGTVNMYGGVIENCASSKSGGAVYMNNGEFTVYRGLINYCKSDEKGGAVAIDGGTFFLALCPLSYNEAQYGGAIYINSGEFYSTGSQIDYNKAIDGGAVYINDGTFYFLGGFIVYNEAENNGGGIFNNNNGTFAMDNSYNMPMIYNTAKNGAAVYNNGTFEFQNGDMTYNTASECAGAIYNTGTVKMTGGLVNMNESEGRCGGVMNIGKFVMSNGSISSNKSASTAKGMENWGELYLAGTCFISFNNDVIIGNRAKVEIVAPLTHLTATTPVATFTPVWCDEGYESMNHKTDYEIGRSIITGEAEVLLQASEKLAVTSGKDGTWSIDGEGKLQFTKNPFDFKIIIIIVVIIIIIILAIIILPRKNKKTQKV